jgi:hypothetical protein
MSKINIEITFCAPTNTTKCIMKIVKILADFGGCITHIQTTESDTKNGYQPYPPQGGSGVPPKKP